MALTNNRISTGYTPYTPTYGANTTAGYRCDGFNCGASITLTRHLSGAAWTFTRYGKSYCPACTPIHNPQHACPTPEPHTCPTPPAPPRLTEDDTIGLARTLVVTYWHKDEGRARRWLVLMSRAFVQDDGVHVLKYYADGKAPKVHHIPWDYVISLKTERPAPR